jgi:GTP pyrophosphokinase
MIRFEDILETVESYAPEKDIALLRKAYVFSAMEHQGQVRLSGEPYLTHPLEVAYILAKLRLDMFCVIAGLLHDIVEDTAADIKEVRKLFGKEIANIVEGVTKIGRIEEHQSKEEMEAENLRRMMLAMVDDLRVILVKLADRLHNMRTLQYLDSGRRKRIAKETLEIYAPISHRLGMGKIKNELEGLALKYLNPQAYEGLIKDVENTKKISQRFIEEISGVLKSKLEEQGIHVEIHNRIKSPFSIFKKMKIQEVDFSQIYDLVAFRIITETIKDCYAALGVIHSAWKPVPGRFRDFIAMPKRNMYQSLHTSVVSDKGEAFEVQIRTISMHIIAEEGIAAHWRYKEGGRMTEKELLNVQWLRQLMEWQQEVKDPREFLKTVKVDLFPDEVYVFTPKGKVIVLPRGATPIDFAYAIHTEIGHQCIGAQVNGKLAPLKTLLKSGDRVEILTSPGHHPSRDWLKVVATSRAKSKIRNWIIANERDRSLSLGRELCEKEFRKYRFHLKDFSQENDQIKNALDFLNCKNIEDFYASVGYGKLTPYQLISKLMPSDMLRGKEKKESPITKVVKKAFGIGDKKVKVKGVDDIMVYLAKCCNPIKGEKIVGYITRGKGVSVHSVNCPNAEKLVYNSERRIEVEWDHGYKAVYEVRLFIDTDDCQGMLAKLTSTISEERTNIKNMDARSLEGKRGEIQMILDIHDKQHLDRIISRIKELDGVHIIERR